MAGTGKSRGPETAGGVKVAGRLRAGEFTPGRLRGGLLRLSQWRLDLAGRLARAFEHERDTGSLFNFAPVALGLGILTYFTLASEPVAPVVWASALAAAALAWRLESRGAAYLAAVAVALFFIGMGAAQLRTSLTETPLIARQMSAELTGLVLAVDRNARGSPRYLIRPTAIAGLKEDGIPRHIRLSASAGKERFAPGDAIAGKARLMPFSGPAYPGGYDFGFFASFDRLGGTGFFLGAPHRGGVVAPWAGEKVAIALNRLRLALGARIRAGLAGEPGDVAVALITGDRSGIDKDTADSLRRSGLAHVLAISGLHMALVALAVVWSLRWLLAWFPPLVAQSAGRQMGRRRRTGRGDLLSRHFRCVGGDPARLDNDRGHADGDTGRPARNHHSKRSSRGDRYPGPLARKRAGAGLPDVVCGRRRACGRL